MLIANIPQAYLATLIMHLAPLLLAGANGSLRDAREAACTMISSYEPRTEAELRLAVRIIGFNLQIGEALSQAADPATPLSRIIRLRSGAVAMSREVEKAERRLEKLRAEPAAEAPQPIELPPQLETAAEEAPVPVAPPTPEEARQIAEFAQAHGLTLIQALQHRDREMRLVAREQMQRSQAAA